MAAASTSTLRIDTDPENPCRLNLTHGPLIITCVCRSPLPDTFHVVDRTRATSHQRRIGLTQQELEEMLEEATDAQRRDDILAVIREGGQWAMRACPSQPVVSDDVTSRVAAYVQKILTQCGLGNCTHKRAMQVIRQAITQAIYRDRDHGYLSVPVEPDALLSRVYGHFHSMQGALQHAREQTPCTVGMPRLLAEYIAAYPEWDNDEATCAAFIRSREAAEK